MQRIKHYFGKKKFFEDYKDKVLNNSKLSKSSDFKKIFNTPLCVPEICIYDVLDNKGATKLIKKIHRMRKNNNYKVDIYYRKPVFKRYNYIHPQFEGTSHGILASIQFLNDDLIKELTITWTQINNEEAVLCYNFRFIKCIESELELKEYVKNNWNKISSYGFVPYYQNVDFYIKHEHKNIELEHKLFYYLIQGIIVDIFYTDLGKYYILPVSTLNLVEKETARFKKYLENPFFESTFVNKTKQNEKTKNIYYVVGGIRDEGSYVEEFVVGTSYSSSTLLDFFADYRMEYYYQQFCYIEINELSRRMMNYLNKRRKNIKISDHKWLVSKIRKINEKKLYKSSEEYKSNLYGYSKGIENKEYISEDNYLNKFKDVYQDNLDYINSIGSINYNYKIYIVTIITLFLTILSILIAVYPQPEIKKDLPNQIGADVNNNKTN